MGKKRYVVETSAQRRNQQSRAFNTIHAQPVHFWPIDGWDIPAGLAFYGEPRQLTGSNSFRKIKGGNFSVLKLRRRNKLLNQSLQFNLVLPWTRQTVDVLDLAAKNARSVVPR
jgi:hypothetical protein